MMMSLEISPRDTFHSHNYCVNSDYDSTNWHSYFINEVNRSYYFIN